MNHIPPKPPQSFRVEITLLSSRPRLDQVLLEHLRKQTQSHALKNITRSEFKDLFKNKRIQIKGQPALASSSLAAGTTHIDLLGFEVQSAE